MFLDGTAQFSTKNKLYECSFVVKNLLNNKKIIQVEANDFSKIYFESNLIPRYFLLSVVRNF